MKGEVIGYHGMMPTHRTLCVMMMLLWSTHESDDGYAENS
jgi:hypothetical protein